MRSPGPPEGGMAAMAGARWTGLLEETALRLQVLVGAPAPPRREVPPDREDEPLLVVGYEEEALGLASVHAAASLARSCLRGEATEAGRVVAELREVYRRARPGTTTAILIEAARRRGIPVRRSPDDPVVQLGLGRNLRRLDASMTDLTSVIATDITSDKDRTKRILQRAGLSVPRGGVAATLEEALGIAAELGPPLLLKPLDANEGRGVVGPIDGEEALRAAWPVAAAEGGKVVVERHVAGRDHRVVVVNGRVVAVAERIPAHVVGDGRRSIRELAGEVNRDPNRDPNNPAALRVPIPLDEATERFLARTGRTLDSVPAPGEWVRLRETANLSTGGTSIDRTDEIHPRNAALCELAAGAVGLDVAGLDVLTPDISVPFPENGAVILEVNASPGLRMHTEPDEGTGRDVPGAILEMLYPPGSESRIPVIAVTGTGGTETAARLIARLLRRTGRVVGLATADGVYLQETLLVGPEVAGPRATDLVLAHPRVEVAVLETTPGAILEWGLGFEDCDVGVVLNAGADGPRPGGPVAARVAAAVVPGAVRSGGRAVLSPADPPALTAAEGTLAEVVLFSAAGEDSDPRLAAHLAAGGRAVVLEGMDEGAAVVVRRGTERVRVAMLEELAPAREGADGAWLESALAAVAAAHALGMAPEVIRAGFRPPAPPE